MKTKNYRPLNRKNNIVVQELNDETLIYDLNANKAFCLNQSSAMVWQLCDGSKTVSEIAELLGKELRMSVQEDFVRLAISDLHKENLIVPISEIEITLDGKSRREIIRNIGLASMIALPVVSSLVAPNAVDAQSSCVTLLRSCTFNNFEQSNCCANLYCNNSPRTCRNCIVAGGSYEVTLGTSSATECQDFCFGLGVQHNKCCNSTHTRNAYEFFSATGGCGCLCE